MEFNKAEESILKFWEKNRIYEKSKKKNSNGKKFYFMDGPPYANGNIHMGHALNKILKDIAMRSQRLQGKDVFDRPGYDTHGLPIEFQVEKEIGSKTKQDIERFGVARFVERCKEFATRYIDVMNKEFANLGVWMDWGNSYKTLDDEYIEGIWNILKIAYEKKLLYLGKYSVHVCPRCATAVAYNEIIYEKQVDKAVYVKFPVKNKKNTFFLIWTTTPWTLPANTGIMVHPDFTYVEIETEKGERWFIAKELTDKRMKEFGINYKILKEFKGKELKDIEYENPLDKNLKLKLSHKRRIVLSPRYVTLDEGTGLVHCAPGHGKEDYEVGMENKLDAPSPVAIDGTLTKEAGKYAGKKARIVDGEIVEDLRKDGFLILEHSYSHDYPLCWRCKTPLLMIAQPQWFLRISDIHKKLLEENERVNWIPKWAQSRMRTWLEGISDWPISRERYWGTPLPIWKCDKCEEIKVVGSVAELQKLSGVKRIGMHKPEIDQVTWECDCKRGVMKRVSYVFDVWFDSGATSWAALDYPRDKKLFDKYWPADLNIEGTDQFRGWWNSQLILSVIGFGKKPYESIVVHGLVLDINKRKMSKSEGNITSPNEVIKKYGRDGFRYYLIKMSKGEDFAFNEKEFSEIGKVITILLNINNFVNQLGKGKNKINIEDKWILSKFNRVVKNANEQYNLYKFSSVIDLIEKFIVNDLSRTYIQMIRDRNDEIYDILNEIRLGILKLLAPVIPFITEYIWQELREKRVVKEESVHLSEFPKTNIKLIDEKLEREFELVKRIIESGLAERDKLKIGLKWPLAKAIVFVNEKLGKEFEPIIASQLNVKKVEFKKGELNVELDTTMTNELEAEGYAREIARRVQAERKRRGLEKKDRINLKLAISDYLRKFMANYVEFLQYRTGAKKIEFSDDKKPDVSFKIKEENVGFSFTTEKSH